MSAAAVTANWKVQDMTLWTPWTVNWLHSSRLITTNITKVLHSSSSLYLVNLVICIAPYYWKHQC